MSKRKIPFITLLCAISLLITSCGPGRILGPEFTPTPTSTFTPTPTSTLTPTATQTNTPTPTYTPTPTSTSTFTPTPTVYPLSQDAVLAEIALQKEDIIQFYKEVGISTDGFVDGSIMTITQSTQYSELLSFSTWTSFLHRPYVFPSDLVNSYFTGFTTNREWEGRSPLYLASQSNVIFVFEDPEKAHEFFITDIETMDKGFKLDMQTIGDESIAFRGWLGGHTPIGGVIWRYNEVYVSFITRLKFEVAPESLITISQNIQARLASASE